MTKQNLALKISNLEYSYKSDFLLKTHHALKGISLEVYEGESFGFLGHNGAGKTTTIKSILGLITPSAGSIEIFGEKSSSSSAREKVGYLPEQPYFYDHLTVTEIVTMYAQLAGVSRSVTSAVDEALERVKIAHKRSARMRSLSKGLTQRVAMAQAIIGKPRLLILDEPFSGLDPLGRKEFKDLLFELKSEGATLFISSHILSDIEHLCDRASVLNNGEIKLIGSISELTKLTGERFELVLEGGLDSKSDFESLASEVLQQGNLLSLSFDSKADADKALKLATEHGIAIERYQTKAGRLEELFMKLVQSSNVDEQDASGNGDRSEGTKINKEVRP